MQNRKGWIKKVGSFNPLGEPIGWVICGADIGCYYNGLNQILTVGGYTVKELKEIKLSYDQAIQWRLND